MSDLIKREDAIKVISDRICDNKWVCECAINSLPSAQPQGELISKVDAVAIVLMCSRIFNLSEQEKWEKCAKTINSLPSADAEGRPQGEWIKQGNTLICPICGAKGEEIKDDYCFNYCPVCGADMRGNTE